MRAEILTYSRARGPFRGCLFGGFYPSLARLRISTFLWIYLTDPVSNSFPFTQSLDTQNPMGRLLRNVLLDFAQFEREMTADRTRDKMYQRAQKGFWNGGNVPYGYSADNKRLVVDGERAERLRFMFHFFSKTPSLARLRDELNRRGWYTRSGKRWSKSGLQQILKNPIYCGFIRFNAERFKGDHEALIDESLFARIQSKGRDCSHSPTMQKRAFLLKGLVRCSECGSWMTPHYTQKKHKDGSVYRIPYYRCTKTIHFENSACAVKSINAEHIEQTVIQKLADLSQNEAYLKISVDELNGDLKRKTEPLEREALRLRKRLDEIENEISRYVKSLGQGKLSIQRLEAEIMRLEADKHAVQIQYDDLQRKINDLAIRDFNADLLLRTLKDFRKAFTTLNPPEQSEALQCVLKQVVVHPRKISLEVFELEEFGLSSQNRKEWLALEDDFRTLGISQIVTEVPQFNQFLAP